jgi:predicted metal-dependent peptidase
MNQKAHNRVQEAVGIIRLTRPVYAVPLLTMPLEQSDKVDVMTTDGSKILYNPDNILTIPLQDIIFTLMHEVLHKWGMHPQRLMAIQGDDHKIANIAADLAVNSVLWEQGENLPTSMTVLFPGQGDYSHLPENQSFETYYKALKEEQQQQHQQQEQGNDDNSSDGGSNPQQVNNPQGDGNQQGQNESGDSNNQETQEGGSDSNPSLAGDLIPAPQNQLENLSEMQAGIAAAGKDFSQQGSVNAVKKLLEQVTEPPAIDWRLKMRSYLTAASTKRKRSFSRESRRTSQFILPSYRKDKTLCETVVVLDTSGSMDEFTYKILGECFEMIRVFPDAKLTVVMCDTKIRHIQQVTSAADIETIKKTGLLGLGGTDMTPAFQYAIDKRAQLIICLTDMIMRFPPRPPMPVVWGQLSRWGRTPDYGEVLKIGEQR